MLLAASTSLMNGLSDNNRRDSRHSNRSRRSLATPSPSLRRCRNTDAPPRFPGTVFPVVQDIFDLLRFFRM